MSGSVFIEAMIANDAKDDNEWGILTPSGDSDRSEHRTLIDEIAHNQMASRFRSPFAPNRMPFVLTLFCITSPLLLLLGGAGPSWLSSDAWAVERPKPA